MPKATSNSIGRRIKELRQQKELSQAELAKLIGCAQTTVAEWERRSDRPPGKRYRERTAEVLGVSIDYLLGVEKDSKAQIPCYGEVLSEHFIWPEKDSPSYYIEIPQGERSSKRFALKVLDDLLEPVIYKDDYGIFEKVQPKNGDIVVVSFPKTGKKTMIKVWRQKGKSLVLSEANIKKVCTPYFFEFSSCKDLVYIAKNTKREIEVRGKLVAVKRSQTTSPFPGIHYIFPS